MDMFTLKPLPSLFTWGDSHVDLHDYLETDNKENCMDMLEHLIFMTPVI